MTISPRSVLAGLSVLCNLMVAATGFAGATDDASAEKPDLLYFYSKDCEHCQRTAREFLPGFRETYGTLFTFVEFEVSEKAAMDSLDVMESRLRVPEEDKDFPAAYFMGRIFEGEKQVRLQLEPWVRRFRENPDSLRALDREVMARAPEVVTPRATTAADTVHIAYFTKHGCSECNRAGEIVGWITRTYPFAAVDVFDIAERHSKLTAYLLGMRCNMPEKRLLGTPVLFVGDTYIFGKDITRQNVAGLVDSLASTGAAASWRAFTTEEYAAAEQGVRALLDTFTVLTVSFAGLVDGINPCAFATILFFVSYLGMIGRRRNEIAMVGLTFAGAVFVTYFLVGLGFFTVIRQASYLEVLAKVVYAGMGAACIVFGVLSIADYVKARAGNVSGMTLQLPAVLKRRIHESIRTNVRTRSLLFGSIAAGVTVSLLELACTGQVYLPTITMLVGRDVRALGYLLLYNGFFILPLLVVFGIVFFGVSSKRIAGIMEANLGPVKLGMAAVFFLIGGLLLWSAF